MYGYGKHILLPYALTTLVFPEDGDCAETMWGQINSEIHT
jgi:hypothetical protein